MMCHTCRSEFEDQIGIAPAIDVWTCPECGAPVCVNCCFNEHKRGGLCAECGDNERVAKDREPLTFDEWLAMCPVPLACGPTECLADIRGGQLYGLTTTSFGTDRHRPVTAIIVERKDGE